MNASQGILYVLKTIEWLSIKLRRLKFQGPLSVESLKLFHECFSIQRRAILIIISHLWVNDKIISQAFSTHRSKHTKIAPNTNPDFLEDISQAVDRFKTPFH